MFNLSRARQVKTHPPSLFPSLRLVSPFPLTSLCVVVATSRLPHYNAYVFVSGVAARLLSFFPFVPLK